MRDTSIEQRVARLEASMGGKTLEQHFREHAELIDRRFVETNARFAEIHARFAAQDKRFQAIEVQLTAVHARFDAMDRRFDAIHTRIDANDERFNRLDFEISLLRRHVTGAHAKLDVILKKLDVP